MCKICDKLLEIEYEKKMNEIYNEINERLKATKKKGIEDEFAYSTTFPLIKFPIFEPRMPLQIPSNFYQNILINEKRIRNDWSNSWIRAFGFDKKNLYLFLHTFRTIENKEYLMQLLMVEFPPEEYKINNGNKFSIEVNTSKEVMDLINDKRTTIKISFSFIHQITTSSILPRDRIESYVKRIYGEKISQKPLVFDFTQYVITTPHFAPHPILHRNFSKFGYKSALEMQNDVINILKEHI